jgi:two-component system, OmpR family, sensor kinase
VRGFELRQKLMPKGRNDIRRPDRERRDPSSTAGANVLEGSRRDPKVIIAELREAVRTREEFIAFAAHELRNPVTPIALCVRLIRAAEASGDRAKLCSELDRLERLLNRFLRRAEVLLDVTQLVSGKLRLEPAETRLPDVIRGVIDDLNSLLVRSGSTLSADLGQEVNGLIDPVAFAQIAENLLSNAIRYGLGKPIQVGLRPHDGNALLVVRDCGLGISPADQARVFEPFERAVRKDDKPGFGLGLWVTRRLAEAMGGSITVSSEKGAGSEFVVRLPLNP